MSKFKEQKVAIVFDKLNVNAIDAASGIFIGGTNVASGWSSHGKQNSGFGTLHHSVSIHSRQLLNDNDVVDAPVDDRDHFFIHHDSSRQSSSKVSLTDINVNSLDSNASISVGEVSQAGWSSHNKSNSGSGRHAGINISIDDVIKVLDNDMIDSPVQTGDSARQKD